MREYGIVVVGGGLSGVAAAIAAAREGMKVLLVEKGGALGGAAVNCLVNPFMPYWTKVEEDGESKRFELSRGLFTKLNEELDKLGARKGTMFHEEYLKLALDRMVKEYGVEVLLHSTLAGVDVEKDEPDEPGRIVSISVTGKAGIIKLAANYFIDATGDADLAVFAGCPWHLGRDEDHLCQPMTLCFRVGNIDLDKYRESRATITPKYQELQRAGKIRNPREDVLIFHTMIDGMLHFNSTRVVKLNPVDPFDITKAEIEAREQVFELFAFLKDNIDGFQNAELVFSAPEIGVRESRMIDGAYLLTESDLKNCTRFDDAIAAGNYDIDIHNPSGSGTSHYYFPEGQYYTIPYRSLQPVGVDNLLVTGRCISSTHEAQASYRIMPICTCLGEAAGVGASVAAKMGVPVGKADIREIQSILRKNGQFIG